MGSRLKPGAGAATRPAEGAPQASSCASVSLSFHAVAGRPSVLLLPVRRESAAADTRREYVRDRPFSGLQAGPRSFPLSNVCFALVLACLSLRPPGKPLLVLGRADCTRPPCVLGPVRPCCRLSISLFLSD